MFTKPAKDVLPTNPETMPFAIPMVVGFFFKIHSKIIQVNPPKQAQTLVTKIG